MQANIPDSPHKRLVIVGGGFAGIELAKALVNQAYQVVLLDRNNHHQFQPLFYQVATAGLEPSSISFPLRKLFHGAKNVHIRVADVYNLRPEDQEIDTDLGPISYDYLALATGADTHYFGQENIKKYALPMKSVSEALGLRNHLLGNYEKALTAPSPAEAQAWMNIVVVGGGPTGVEVSGALAEMRSHVLPKDLPELDFSRMKIYLLEASPRLLAAMKPVSSQKAEEYLKDLGVEVRTQLAVKDYDGETVTLANGEQLATRTLIWAAGVRANFLKGLPETSWAPNGRLVVDTYNRVHGYSNVFALGDLALLSEDPGWPKGHPQVAQPAIQQGRLLAQNLKAELLGRPWKPFHYKDLGSMATIGRNKAVVELPFWNFQGWFAWLTWLLVHLMSLVGARNKVVVFLNWAWSYISFDQSLRLIIRPKEKG